MTGNVAFDVSIITTSGEDSGSQNCKQRLTAQLKCHVLLQSDMFCTAVAVSTNYEDVEIQIQHEFEAGDVFSVDLTLTENTNCEVQLDSGVGVTYMERGSIYSPFIRIHN